MKRTPPPRPTPIDLDSLTFEQARDLLRLIEDPPEVVTLYTAFVALSSTQQARTRAMLRGLVADLTIASPTSEETP